MKKLLFAAVAGLCLAAPPAIAQTITLPQVTNVGTTDLFKDVTGGVPTAQNKYATAQAMNGVFGYVIYVATDGFSLTFKNAQKYYYIQPAAGLTSGTFTMMPNPGNGQMACIRSTQTVGTLTVTANTGQSIAATPTVSAMSANTNYCWLYNASGATWYPI